MCNENTKQVKFGSFKHIGACGVQFNCGNSVAVLMIGADLIVVVDVVVDGVVVVVVVVVVVLVVVVNLTVQALFNAKS